MSIFNSPKPKLLSVQVPWKVSASTSFLNLLIGEVPDSHPTEVTFLSFDLTEEIDPSVFREVDLDDLPSSEELIINPNMDFDPRDKVVKVAFKYGACARIYPIYSGVSGELIPYSLYDWSEIKYHLDLESKSEWDIEELEESKKLANRFWQQTGFCPDPHMYVVENSPWLQELQANGLCKGNKDMGITFDHYLIIGHSCYIDVIAEGWSWRFLSRNEVTSPRE
jgi:hypothetical protein